MRKATPVLVAMTLTLSTLLAACTSPVQSPTNTTSKPPTSTSPTTTSPKPTPTPTPSASATPQYGGVMNVVEPTTPLGPLGSEWEGGDQEAEQYFMERMLAVQIDGTMGPALAASWDIVSDPTKPSLTFHLRQGVKFTDGSDWNAQTFAWNVDIFKNPGKYVPGDAPRYASATDYWDSVDILDNYTARVNFALKGAPIWRNIFPPMWEYYFMASKTAFDTNGNTWMRTHMVGTGPFKQTDFQQDVSITGVKNDSYYIPGRPYLDSLKLNYVTDPLTRTALFKTGGGDMLSAGAQLAQQQFQNQGYTILPRPGGPFVFAPDSMNADSPWAKLPVRQALSYALDRESLAKVFGYGYGGPAYQMADPLSQAYDSTITGTKYDPVKAKQLLSDAGYPNGFSTRIIANPSSLNKDALTAIQSQMAAVGITADIQYPTPVAYAGINIAPISPSNALLYLPQTDYANFNITFNVSYTDPPAFGLMSLKKAAGWSALYEKSITAPAPDPVLLKQASQMFYNDMTVIPVYYNTTVVVLSPKLHNTGLTTFGTALRWYLPDTWLSK